MFSIKFKPSAINTRLVRRNRTSCLWASFESSQPPILWQMDLEKNPNFTLSLRETEGEWDLGYKSLDGQFVVIAHFDERGEAETAFDAVTKTLAKNVPSAAHFPLGRILALLALLVVAYLALDIMFGSAPAPVSDESAPQITESMKPSTSGKMETGVPVNADDVLPSRP